MPADSKPTAAEAATARNVRIDRLTMTFPLHCAATSRADTSAETTQPSRL
jgi:hypothetical protein